MKKSLSVAITLAALMAPAAAFAEGFGLIEYTTEGVAMGGAAMFIENDAGNMAYNPAGMTLCEGEQLKFSATYISPHGKSRVMKRDVVNPLNGQTTTFSDWTSEKRNRVHPAWAPGTYYARKIDDKQWWGIGCFSRFGNKSEFFPGTDAASNNRYANMKGLSITPTYARRSGRKFYWAVGADINYVGLELQKNFSNGIGNQQVLPNGQIYSYTIAGDHGNNKTEGESWALGWNVGLRYSATDKDEFGFAYRSKITHTMDADFDWYGISPVLQAAKGLPQDFRSRAHGKVTLPDSYHIGYSHKFDSKNRVEVSAIRTQWHNFKDLVLNIDGFGSVPSAHNWKDNWRYAIGYEHHFSKKYTGMIGFSYDEDAIPYDGGDFMVPTGCRRTYSIGMKYHDKRHTLAFTFAWQVEGDNCYSSNYSTDTYKSAYSYDNIAKIFSIGYTYHF